MTTMPVAAQPRALRPVHVLFLSGSLLSHPRDAPEGSRVDALWLYLSSKLVLEAPLTIQQRHHLDAA